MDLQVREPRRHPGQHRSDFATAEAMLDGALLKDITPALHDSRGKGSGVRTVANSPSSGAPIYDPIRLSHVSVQRMHFYRRAADTT